LQQKNNFKNMKKYYLILSLFFFSTIIVTAQQKVRVNPIVMDDNFDNISLNKLNEAAKILDSVFNSEEFAKQVLATNFKVGNFGLTSADILEVIKSGMDSFANKPKDYSIDIRVTVYDKYKGGDEFGRTNMNTHVTETHRCYILNNDVKCYVSHLAHEYLHEIGFYDERTWVFGKKNKSVPYKIGDIVDTIIKNKKPCYAQHSTCTKN